MKIIMPGPFGRSECGSRNGHDRLWKHRVTHASVHLIKNEIRLKFIVKMFQS